MKRCLAWIGGVVVLSFAVVVRAEGAKPTIHLFNGKNLDGWTTYTTETKHENPGIFTVSDGMLKIAGGAGDRAYFGGVITKERHENYRLVVEYKFTGPTYGTRKDKARDSGILVHCVDVDGPGPWPASIECQIIEGGDGDIIFVGGKDETGAEVRHTATFHGEKRNGEVYYQPDGPLQMASGGRVNWFGRDPKWRDVANFRGANDVQSTLGQWTRIECVCKGDSMTNIVNGTVVNQASGLARRKGRILIQTEGAELLVRRVELTPLD
jgi:hypothetical protein